MYNKQRPGDASFPSLDVKGNTGRVFNESGDPVGQWVFLTDYIITFLIYVYMVIRLCISKTAINVGMKNDTGVIVHLSSGMDFTQTNRNYLLNTDSIS